MPSDLPDTLPEKKSEMCRALARQLREMAEHPGLGGRKAEILRQAEEWERIAKLADDEAG